jgi:hypothetical protein
VCPSVALWSFLNDVFFIISFFLIKSADCLICLHDGFAYMRLFMFIHATLVCLIFAPTLLCHPALLLLLFPTGS